jgi:stage II sporulation protein AA (anti-sigma F factor antagonist)
MQNEKEAKILCYRILILIFGLLGYPPQLMQTTQLNIERQPASNGDTLVTRLTGKLSLETVHNFIATMRPEPATRLVLDMGGLLFLDSAGVGALVSLFVSRRNNSKTLALAALTQQGNAVMQVSGLLKLMPVYSSVEEAVSKRP